MIPLLERYQLVTPGSLAEALDDLARHPEARPFAGGTDLMVMLEAGQLPPGRYLSLAACAELRGIARIDAGGVSIGALTTYTEILRSPEMEGEFGLLKRAAAETGGVATQNRGTVGGNIANASPAADTPPVLIVYDAELELLSSTGARRVPYREFHRGYKQMDLRPGEIIARVILPPREATRASGGATTKDYYRKVGTRRAQAISKVCLAASMTVATGPAPAIEDLRIAVGSVAPTVVRARQAEAALRGRALDAGAIADAEQALLSEIAPIDDVRSTARYRARVAANLLREFLTL
jgi:CO/xanthine dehydrogenase FAD-binding subunit